MSETTSLEDSPGLLSALLRFWWVPLLGVLFGLLVASAVTDRIDEEYEASTTFKLGTPISTSTVLRPNPPTNGDHTATQAALISSLPVRETVAAQFPDLTADDLTGRISLSSDDPSLSMTITATGSTGQEAADIANAFVGAYQEASIAGLPLEAAAASNTLSGQIADLEAEIAADVALVEARSAVIEAEQANLGFIDANQLAVNQRSAIGSDPQVIALNRTIGDSAADLSDLQLRRAELTLVDFPGYVVRNTVEPAVAADDPTQPQPTLYRLLGAVAGLGLGAIVASWLTEQLPKADANRAIDAADKAGQPMLVELGGLKDSSKVVVQSSKSPNAAAYEDLLFSTLHQIPIGERAVISVAGPEDAPGPSVATNMALAAARKELNVVLVDADSEERILSRAAQVNDRTGLINLGAGDVLPDQCAVSWAPGGGQAVDFIGSGTGARGSASQFFRSADLTKALDVLAASYDLIILNGPHFPGSGHVQALSRESSFTVLTVSDDSEDTELELLRQRANLLQGNIAGLAVSHQARPWWRPASVDALMTKFKTATRR